MGRKRTAAGAEGMQSAYGPHNRPAIRELRISRVAASRERAANLSFTLVDEYRNVGTVQTRGTVPIGRARTRRATMATKGTCGMESTIEIRRTADRIEGGAGGRFRRRRQMERSLKADALTLRAVRRAQAGDGDALRLLYLLYADNVFGYVVLDRPRRARRRGHHAARSSSRLPRALGALPSRATAVRGLAAARRPQRRARPPASAAVGAHARRSAARTSRSRTSGARALATTCARRSRRCPHDQRQVMLLRLSRGSRPARSPSGSTAPVDAVHALQHRGRRRLRTELTLLGWAPTALAA